MTKVIAGITTSIDGYITGPHDVPGRGLGDGGERLHYWVFGGPWTYADGTGGEMGADDKAYFDPLMARIGAVVGGRGTYEAAEHWGGSNPWPVHFYIVTHRPEEEPKDAGFTFVDGLSKAIELARGSAGDKDVSLMGGADVIRQALADGLVDELSISIAPITLGAGKRLFEGFEQQLDVEPIDVRQSRYATHISYRIPRRS
ncbi:MAG: dihydrofolate reductase family protein [Candidatus Limnocylindrales bacterium]